MHCIYDEIRFKTYKRYNTFSWFATVSVLSRDILLMSFPLCVIEAHELRGVRSSRATSLTGKTTSIKDRLSSCNFSSRSTKNGNSQNPPRQSSFNPDKKFIRTY